MFLRFCQILGISSEYVQSMFRVCLECVESVSKVCSILKSFHHLAHLVCLFLAFFLILVHWCHDDEPEALVNLRLSLLQRREAQRTEISEEEKYKVFNSFFKSKRSISALALRNNFRKMRRKQKKGHKKGGCHIKFFVVIVRCRYRPGKYWHVWILFSATRLKRLKWMFEYFFECLNTFLRYQVEETQRKGKSQEDEEGEEWESWRWAEWGGGHSRGL